MNMRDHIDKLLELIDELVNDDSIPWTKKKELILQDIGEGDETSLEEFCSWLDKSD
jgi:hypothetical protein